ncbi:putative restriction/modification enzyme [Halorubrum aidingense JCM 13560]|uniref:Putative restriction/modification enzyme n=1 Tax=Halorubrum aidingense JCM 13560 TaxID=1230454 RepID=M0PGU4_9EURY|nr:hypothetical protein [Halorubrum aidingense]EMA68809.1 putative restriction/modification enzyme [Halorubrum aidingense JCM 13560]
MSQATLSSTVYRNSDFFSGYFLDERADELDEKIQRTDDLIDETVYELYGLTDEEIEIVEDAVGE